VDVEAGGADGVAAPDEAAGVEVVATGAGEGPLVAEEPDEPEPPQPATARQANTSAPLAYRRMDADLESLIGSVSSSTAVVMADPGERRRAGVTQEDA
jgi:hypothetical protein